MIQKKNKNSEFFPIVAIGASAGGLESLESFLKSFPENSGYALVIIQHLDPTKKSIMVEIIQRFTSMKVVAASDRNNIEKNTVYVIPSGKTMSILNRTLYLFEPTETRGHRLPIDFFFTSLADDLGEESIGIILSGMGSDGSRGVAAIKSKSGLVIVQTPESAQFDSMPRNAILAVNPDLICIPSEIPSRLSAFIHNRTKLAQSKERSIDDLSALEKIIIILRRNTGHDFSQYKHNTLYRRIERRMNLHKISRYKEYIIYLQENSEESEILFKELLIGVTQFNRDPLVWQYFTSKVFPSIISKATENDTIRVWIPACSTGEEAYTIAIAFKEALRELKKAKRVSLQIFATDIDKIAIEKGRKGFYPEFISSDIPKPILKKYFINNESGYQINSEIREMVTFATHDIIQDPPFTKLDIISCRNMLIYMEPDLQSKILSLFHYCLNPNGTLVLGISESIGSQSSLYSNINSKMRIFRKNQNSKANLTLELPSFAPKKLTKDLVSSSFFHEKDAFQESVNSYLLENFAPPGIIVNEIGDILFISGKIGNFLEPSFGKASMNLFSMIKPGLKNELATGFRKAKISSQDIFINNLKINKTSKSHLVDIHIHKIDKPENLSGMFMITFVNEKNTQTPKSKSKSQADNKTNKKIPVSKLAAIELELENTRSELDVAMQDMQISQEELKSANEEMQSSNEELQSTNEELTTSKEEMQSLNEELQTVNAELQSRVDEYIAINNDFKNLLDSTDIATLFLDKDLNIRRYTKQTSSLFKIIKTDLGRPFTDIVSQLNYADISKDAQAVLDTLVTVEKEISTTEGLWYSVKIMPYRTTEDKIDGLVITFNEITETKNLEFQLRKTNNALDEKLNEVNRLLEEKETILKEVHHRIKNNMGTILSIISIQSDESKNPEIQANLQDIYGRIYSMMVLYEKLYNSNDLEFISIKEYMDILVKEVIGIFPNADLIKVNIYVQDFEFPAKKLPSFGIIINELITNSMKYGFLNRKSGLITISLTKQNSSVLFKYEDDGPGFDIKNLSNQAKGFGLQLIDILVKQIKGELKIDSSNGSKYNIKFEI